MKKIFIALLFSSYISAPYAVDLNKTFGDWFVVSSDDGDDLIAATSNDSDSILAFRCFSKTQDCIHILLANINCDDGSEYPILVNSDFSAMTMDAMCGDGNDSNELYLSEYDTIHEILQKGNDIGFAIPMESGRFKVVRFSLNGSDSAMNYVEKRTPRSPSASKKDTYL